MKKKLVYALFLILLIAGVFINLEAVPLKLEEPRRALVSLEMMLSEEFILPSVNGAPYLKKPPVFNWVLIGSYKLFGTISEWTTRMPTVISFLCAVMLLIWTGWRFIAPEFGLLSGLLFGTSARVLFYGVNYAEIDLFFTLIQLLSVLSFFILYQKQKLYLAFVLAYFFCAIGILTKSFPALAFTGLSIVAFLAIKRDVKNIFSLAHATGILTMAFFVGIYLYVLSGRISLAVYFDSIIGDSTQRTVAENGFLDLLKHLFSFPLEMWLSLLPGGFLVIFIFTQRDRFKSILMGNELILFCCIVFCANFWIYWISPGARMRYVFMLFPFALNVFLYFYWVTQKRKRNSMLSLPFSIIAIITGLGLIFTTFFYDLSSAGRIILIITGIILVLLPWVAKRWALEKLSGFILLFLLLRICYSLVILPIRAEDEASVDKEDAQAAASLIGNEPLYVTEADAMNNRPVYYLTLYNGDVLREKRSGTGFFLIKESERMPSDSVMFSFRNQSYRIVNRRAF